MNTNNKQLEAAKGWYKIAKEQNNNVAIEILENMFPELKESEDDEKHIKTLIGILDERLNSCDEGSIVYDVYKEEQDWLKSLRIHNTWKPSEEQMNALNTCLIKGEISYVGQGSILQSLYDKLKTL